ncbi:DUF4489 domain-containing protein [Tepidibacter aestuarii]|uniref:DUF4489 domain-containing protein n=1 Tax=Tepidibacter aestuarii TaxID=2925782 RepID=UPI0020BE6DAE|nr:DUF4489 domain-containing protein [Tepidibacter aestuarii]CAH2213898.1 DUF4489 domain-containing protein [Tepidibacter aestuarii]
MKVCSGMPFLNCGKVFKDSFPNYLTPNNKPINLALVKVDTRNIKNPHVLINYSQNLEFEIGGFNPKLSIAYRLIRKSNHTERTRVLECWNYKASEVIPTTVQELSTIEPLVLNFCDCLGDSCDSSFIYILQIVEIITENTSFNITNQEMSAIVNYGNSNRG